MKIKEFEALTLKECLQQVRQELGPEAVILETRKLRRGGIMGWGAHDTVRIVAATGIVVDERRREAPRDNPTRPAVAPEPGRSGAAATQPARPRPAAAAAAGGSAGGATATAARPMRPAAKEDVINGPGTVLRRPVAAGAAAAPALRPIVAARTHDPETQEKLARLDRELSELKEGIRAIHQAAVLAAAAAPAPAAEPAAAQPQPASASAPTVPYPELYGRLRAADVPEELAAELVSALPDMRRMAPDARAPLALAALRDLMASRVKIGGAIESVPGARKVIAFVGPTGVGKTTTIAKLAAQFALLEKRKVGLLTMDTYRIAAVEQMKTYSQIIDIPIAVAYNQSEVLPALEKFADCDLVLVDTAGRSHKNAMQVGELKTLVDTAGCETHLVLAASTKEIDLFDQVERFSGAGIDRLLFTKLDETATYGTMFAVAAGSGIPVSYVTTGQKVPEDIEAATGERCAALVLGDA